MKALELIYKIALTAMCAVGAVMADTTPMTIVLSIMAVLAGVLVIDDIVMMIWEKRK